MFARFEPAARFSHLSAILVMGLMILLATGCASDSGPEVLTIGPAEYHAAFDAAVEAARVHGMPASLQNRRAGVIETEVRVAGSLLEPWRNDNASFGQAGENTLGFQRRRARFEFVPAGFQSPDPEPDETLTGPDIVGVREPPPELTQIDQPLELRVWVYVERAHAPGVRRSTWTRTKTTSADLIAPEGEAGLPDGTFWVPVTRDRAYERRLLGAVEKALGTAVVSGAPAAEDAAR